MVSDSTVASDGERVPVPAPESMSTVLASRTDTPPAWDERTMLATFLDYTRATVHAKCAGIAEDDARRAPLPGSPLMTISGLVSHLRWVEAGWFEHIFLGGDDLGPCTDEDPDREMRVAVEIPIVRLLAEYEAECARNRRLVASLDLDTLSKRKIRSGEPVTLRWIIMHLIEETARHNGHIDLLREMADGVTGD